ncbi:MAG: polysaccharide deacetylase [Thermaerobacter sp.]|nr:polysaccharide deacetylase [Thermaerobacter sp.]
MARHLVTFGFDFDAMSLYIVRNMTSPTPISRGEFGVVGTDRILRLLERYQIKGTWFTPGHTLETYPEISARIFREGHELAHHGYTHEPPATLMREQEEAVIVRANEVIKRITGKLATGYRSPSWDLSPHTVELLRKHGFKYDSSMMGNDFTPYFARQGDVITADMPAQFGVETDLVEMPIHWSLDDFPHFEYLRMPTYLQQGLHNADDVLANWLGDFEYMRRNTDWGVLSFTFHPQVSGRGHRMLMLERLIVELKGRGATFVRLDEAAEEFRSRKG